MVDVEGKSRFTFWNYNCVPPPCSFVRFTVAESRTKSEPGNGIRHGPPRLVKKLVAAGGGYVPYLLCRCRAAINSPEFTAVEKRHTANIIHRTRPVIRRENRVPSRTTRGRATITKNRVSFVDSFSRNR